VVRNEDGSGSDVVDWNVVYVAGSQIIKHKECVLGGELKSEWRGLRSMNEGRTTAGSRVKAN
jgi:hypothetical protein